MAKASLHSGGASSGSAKHNDKKRDFKKKSNSQNLDYIDDSKSQENINLMFSNGQFVVTEKDLQQIAHERYEEVFGKALEEQNQKAINARHLERIKTIDDWMADSKHGARETLLQIGSDENRATKNGKELTNAELKEELHSCFNELNTYVTEILGEHYQPMHAAIHMDELTPHMHWDYSIAEKDTKSGTLKPGLNKGLEQAGIELPNADRINEIQKLEQEEENRKAEAEGRKPKKVKATPNKYNNRLVTLTSMIRDKWEDIILSHGIEIERSEHCDRQHEDQNRYRQKQLQTDISKKTEEISNLETSVSDLEDKKGTLDSEISTKKQSVATLDNEIAEKSKKNKDLDKIIQEKQDKFTALNDEITAKESINAELDEQIKGKEKYSNALTASIENQKTTLQTTQKSVLNAQNQLLGLKNDISALKNEKQVLEENKEHLKDDIETLTTQKASLEETIKALTGKISEKISHIIGMVFEKITEKIHESYYMAPSDPEKALKTLDATERTGHRYVNTNIEDTNITVPVNNEISSMVDDARENIAASTTSNGSGRKSILAQLEKNKEIIKARDEAQEPTQTIHRPIRRGR